MRPIDADELKLKLPSTYHNGFENCRECRLLEREEVNAYIDRMPTIDAAPVKHGRWLPVLNGKDDDSNPAFDCSECDAMCRKQHNYCPRCGAKMDLDG